MKAVSQGTKFSFGEVSNWAVIILILQWLCEFVKFKAGYQYSRLYGTTYIKTYKNGIARRWKNTLFLNRFPSLQIDLSDICFGRIINVSVIDRVHVYTGFTVLKSARCKLANNILFNEIYENFCDMKIFHFWRPTQWFLRTRLIIPKNRGVSLCRDTLQH